MSTADEDITAFLEAVGASGDHEVDELFADTYAKLRRLAHSQRRRWQGQQTLSTTALVHEAYLKLSKQGSPRWRTRGHFFGVAARAMRHILVNYAERSLAVKRGGGMSRVAAEEVVLVEGERTETLLALDEALTRLEALSPRQARVVECRFFAGLDIDETADALDISPATVKRDWRRSQAWLYRELSAPAADEDRNRQRGSEP